MPEDPANVNATSALPDDIRESVAVDNIKTVASAPAVLTNMMLADQVASQRRVNAVADQLFANSIAFAQNATAQAIKAIAESDLAEQLSQLNASIASSQQVQKGAGNTPPVTP